MGWRNAHDPDWPRQAPEPELHLREGMSAWALHRRWGPPRRVVREGGEEWWEYATAEGDVEVRVREARVAGWERRPSQANENAGR